MATLQLKDVHKSYGDVQIIKGVDLAIEDREFCVFVGPSGCGKSTLLRMIAGLEEITAGELTHRRPARQRRAALGPRPGHGVPVLRPLPAHDGRGQYGLLPAARRGAQGGARKKVGEAAKVLHLDQLLARKPKELSGGQRQRVAIGRAIVRKPKVFLFDEPLSNLDAALRVQMRIELARLHDELKATMIYVTHDQVEAMTMADKIVVLQAGVIEQAGSPARALPPPAQPVRRRLHRQPEDELPAGQGDGRRRRRRHRSAAGRLEHHRRRSSPGGSRPATAVTLGVRPEHLRPAEVGRDPGRGHGGRAARRRDLPLHPDRWRQRDAGDPGRRRDPDPRARQDHGQARPA